MLPYKKISNDGMTYHDNCPICKIDRKEWKKNIKPLTEKARIKKYTDNLIKEQLQDYEEETDSFYLYDNIEPDFSLNPWPIEYEFDDEYDEAVNEHIINPKQILFADGLTLKDYLKMQQAAECEPENEIIGFIKLPPKRNWLQKLFYKIKTFLLTRFE